MRKNPTTRETPTRTRGTRAARLPELKREQLQRGARAVTEQELERGVIQLAQLLGYRVAHFGVGLSRKAWRTPVPSARAGWPDLVIVGNGRAL